MGWGHVSSGMGCCVPVCCLFVVCLLFPRGLLFLCFVLMNFPFYGKKKEVPWQLIARISDRNSDSREFLHKKLLAERMMFNEENDKNK